MRTVTFSSDSSQECGWETGLGPVAIPCRARECLDLFQNIFLFSMEQSLTDKLLIWRKSRKVQPDMRTDKSRFLLCPDETQPICCRQFLSTMKWSIWTFSVPLIFFVINALQGRQAQWETFFSKISLQDDSDQITCVFLVVCCLYIDYSHDLPLILI